MTPAPLQLLDYWATSLHMEANTGYDPRKPAKFEFDSIDVVSKVEKLESRKPEQNGSHWLVDLTVEQTAKQGANLPYTFSVSLQGIVVAHPDLEGERLDRLVRANGPAMLFGAAREMIRAATGRGPHKAIIIPSTNFLSQSDQSARPSSKKKSAKKVAGKRTRKARS